MAQNQVIIVGKKRYAVGLFWQPIAAGFNGRIFAKNLARKIDRRQDLFVEYRGMIGLGNSRTGIRAGMPSAADEVMETLAEHSSFLATFRVSNGFWTIAVRNGVILHDNLVGDETAAQAEFKKLLKMPDWAGLYAPAEWNILRAAHRELGELLVYNPRVVMQKISRAKTNFTALFLIIALIVGFVYFMRAPLMEVISPTPRFAPSAPIDFVPFEPAPEPHIDDRRPLIEYVPAQIVLPSDMLPDPLQRAALCFRAIGFLMQPVPGWIQQNVSCNTTHATVVFRRSFGNLGDFYIVASELFPGAIVEERSESELHLSARLPDLPLGASIEHRDVDTIVRDVNTLFQRMNAPVDTRITFDDVGGEIVNVVEVGARSRLIPVEFMKIFGEFEGVYMTSVSWDAQNRTWNYEVIIYAK